MVVVVTGFSGGGGFRLVLVVVVTGFSGGGDWF